MGMIKYPVLFVSGWLFNFIYDIQFMMGFVSGWLAHSWVGDLLM